jgi:hypothetical protein
MALIRMVATFPYFPSIIPLEPCKSLRIFHPFVKKRTL